MDGRNKPAHNRRHDIRDELPNLIKLYTEELLSVDEIAERYHCGSSVINNLLRQNRIITNQSDRKKLLFEKGKLKTWHTGLTKETSPILAEYGKKISLLKKGKPLVHLKKYQFTSEQITKRNLNNNPSKRWDIPDSKVIDLYCNKKYTWREITKELGCSPTLIKNVIKRHNLPRRRVKGYNLVSIFGEEKARAIKKKIGMRLEDNPNWRGGKTFEPYSKEFNENFREEVRCRDGLICIKCGMKQEDSLCIFKRKLHIHHVNYDKKLTIKENCCSLCQRCNSEVNFNRNQWTKFFQSLLSERYGYRYSESGEVILELDVPELGGKK